MTSMVEDKKQILELVKTYCNHYHKESEEYNEGDRIAYAGRVYDEEEMVNLVDSALDFWLTSGRYCNQFEKDFSRFLKV